MLFHDTDSINYLGYKIDQQRIRPQKVQIKRDRLKTLNEYQILLGDIANLWPTIGIKNKEKDSLFKTLNDHKD